MCSDGRSEASPTSARSRSIRSSAAISRIRVLTGTSAISSRSSWSSTSMTFVAVRAAWRSAWSERGASGSALRFVDVVLLGLGGAGDEPLRAAGPHAELERHPYPARSVLPPPPFDGVLSSTDEAEAVRAARPLDAVEDEALLDRRPVDDERERGRLPAAHRVVRDQLDVVLREGLPRGADLAEDVLGVLLGRVEHGQAPQLPVGVARVRVVGVLDRHRPAVAERVADLRVDLLVGQLRQEGERSLRHFHRIPPSSRSRGRRRRRACRWTRSRR